LGYFKVTPHLGQYTVVFIDRNLAALGKLSSKKLVSIVMLDNKLTGKLSNELINNIEWKGGNRVCV